MIRLSFFGDMLYSKEINLSLIYKINILSKTNVFSLFNLII